MDRIRLYSVLFLVVLSCSSCVKKVAQEMASEMVETVVGKEVAKTAVEKTGKELLSEGVEAAVKQTAKEAIEIPTGAKSIATVFDPQLGKYVPAFDNLSGRIALSADDAMKLLIERRKAIAPHMQFLTKEQSQVINGSKLLLGQPKDGAILRKNMLASMPSKVRQLVEGYGGAEAHHIVGDNPATKDALKLFRKLGVDINDPRNGILLPSDGKSIFKGAIHRGGHTDEYHKWVYSQIKDSKTQEELFDNLRKVAYKLYEGKAPLYNTNIINGNGVNAVVKII